MSDIYQTVLTEKSNYETGQGVLVAGEWYWSMYKHCNRTLLMKNSQFPDTQTDLGKRPNKNIILPIVNVAHRTEGFDVKDIELYVNNKDNFHLSFLARKFYYNWAIENKLDTFIDEVVEGLDYGFVLVKNVNDKRPEVVQPQQIAFVDQTDILSGTIALKHQYSIDQLVSTGEELGWYKDKINTAVSKAREEKTTQDNTGTTKTPDKHIEVFEVEGMFSEEWLKKDFDDKYNEDLKADAYCLQVHIITYIKDDKGNKQGICLYKGRREESIFKCLVINPIYGRAAGRGRVEELFEPQVWTNFSEIHVMNMLKNASKTINLTTDSGFTTRNNTKNAGDNEVWVLEEGKQVTQMNTQPINFNLFEKKLNEWEQHARVLGSASDPALGVNPTSGTPLGTTEIVTNQGEGIHEYNRGKIATFIHEIHMDWVLDYLVEDMNKGLEWADELSLEEMQKLAEDVMTKTFNDLIIKKVLNGEIPTEQELAPMRDMFKKEFMKSNTKFIKIVKGQFKNLPLKLKINVAGKQQNTGVMIQKLNSIFRTVIQAPQVLANPPIAKLFNEILEASGLNPLDFSGLTAQPMQPVPSPLQELPVTT